MKRLVEIVAAISFIIFLSVLPVFSAKSSAKDQKVYIYLLSQVIRCYEADQIVFESRVSTGAGWHNTKTTKYKPAYWVHSKDGRGKNSRCTTDTYDVKTPWKIILSESAKGLTGKMIRIHEYHDVPNRPASGGCIRLPEGNGEEIYKWIKAGTPIYPRLEKAPKFTQPK